MDQSSFDRIARLLGGAATRRQGLAAALASIVGAGLAAPAADVLAGNGDAEGRPDDEAKCLKGKKGKRKRCRKHTDCCTGYCKKIRKRKNGKVRKMRRCRCAPAGFVCGAKTRCCGGMTCATGVCAVPSAGECGPATCPTGCCQAGICQTGTDAGACGTSGGACAACDGAKPVCTAGVCSARAWREIASIGGNRNGNPPILDDQNQEITDVHITSDGLQLFMSDVFNNRVTVWTRPDTASTFTAQPPIGGTFGYNDADFRNGFMQAFSSDFLEMFVPCDSRLKHWTRASTSSAWAAQTQIDAPYGTAYNQLAATYGIALSPDTLEIYMTDLDATGYIKVWTRPNTSTAFTAQPSLGNGQGSANDQLEYGRGMAISADGLELFIADTDNNRVAYWKRAATVSAWGAVAPIGLPGPGTGDGQMNSPKGVALSPDSLSIYVADTDNNRIVHWTRATLTSAWEAQTPFGSASVFNEPEAVDVSADGKQVYVADTQNARVAVWSQY
ncbi:MAG: hypothetical protein ACKOWF_10385 [Chloroflexota bacterium]